MTATYRVQLTPDFGFAEAAKLVGYLRDLGVGYLYLSPILQAVRDSMHGYDVVDHSRVRAEFGGEKGLRELAAAGLPLVADIVPNHMTIPVPESENTQLWSALRDGPNSPHARWFDFQWPVAFPILGDEPYGTAVEEVNATAADGRAAEAMTADGTAYRGPALRYHDHVFPIRPGTEHLPLPELLEAQHYRLVNWRESPGYRRFFDVSSLIGLRAEDPEVFAATHAVTFSLIDDGVLHGLRIDHPDGLADPRGYLRRLRPHVPGPLWVEKILIDGERLPADWPCDGTTGYDALNMITRLFVDPSGRDALVDTFSRLTGVTDDYEAVRRESKKHVIELFFRGEVDRLTADLGEQGLREAVVELLVAMPVYRAYVNPGDQPSGDSVRIIREAAREAATRADPDAVAKAADLVLYGPAEAVTRFQQTCGPVMAKGVEDTALYRWYPLACLNEVGGEPDRFGVSAAEFHEFCAGLPPMTMTTLSTHDTKRSEDVRARLAVLSELTEEWARAVGSWAAEVSFDPRLDYLAWQSLMAAWPISVERFSDYLLKAAREAKTAISWMDADPQYEARLREFARRAIEVCGPSVAAFTAVADRYARINSLGQKAVQLLMPGIPDVYQGNEITDFSLVDPDNRRPVDFERRRRLLAAATDDSTVDRRDDDTWDGQKLLVTTTALTLRQRIDPAGPYVPIETGEHAIAFARIPGGRAPGGRVPGSQAPGSRGMAGRAGDGAHSAALVVATRLPVKLERRGGWGSETITLPPGRWRDLLTGGEQTGRETTGRGNAGGEHAGRQHAGREFTGRVPLAHLLSCYPVAILESDPAG